MPEGAHKLPHHRRGPRQCPRAKLHAMAMKGLGEPKQTVLDAPWAPTMYPQHAGVRVLPDA